MFSVDNTEAQASGHLGREDKRKPKKALGNEYGLFSWSECPSPTKRVLVLGETSDRIDKLHTEVLAGPPGMSIETLVNRIAIPTEIFCLDDKKPMDQASVPLKEIKKKTRDRIDRELISYVLKKTRWNRGKAAKILDVSYKMLHNKMDELNIKPII